MLKDIDFKKVEDVAIAVVPDDDGEGKEAWKVYLLNLKNAPIQGVIINSKGYGRYKKKDVETSKLRQFFEKLEPQSYVMVELIYKELLGLTNEFWVSFWKDNFMYDKKYVFVRESLVDEHLTELPLLEKKGVMIK